MPSISSSYLSRKAINRGAVVFGIGSWLGAILMAIFPPDRPGGPLSRPSWSAETWRGEVLFALIFAPLGCIFRFYASLQLNGRMANFPLGTFAANIFGTLIEGMCYDLQHVPLGGITGGGKPGCQVLQGAMDGFSGCATTVSTWVVELNGLGRRHAYFYAAMSVAVALACLVAVMGSVKWTIGFASSVCIA